MSLLRGMILKKNNWIIPKRIIVLQNNLRKPKDSIQILKNAKRNRRKPKDSIQIIKNAKRNRYKRTNEQLYSKPL